MTKWLRAGLVFAWLSAVGSGEGSAGEPKFITKWVMNGAGCVPTDRAIRTGSYAIVAGRITFRESRVGSITAICPVSANVGLVSAIGVSYRDSTGSDTSARVRADVRRINKFDGSVTTVTGLEFNSDNHAETTYTFNFASSPHTLDDVNFYYFIQITLTRTGTSETVEVGGVELFEG